MPLQPREVMEYVDIMWKILGQIQVCRDPLTIMLTHAYLAIAVTRGVEFIPYSCWYYYSPFHYRVYLLSD